MSTDLQEVSFATEDVSLTLDVPDGGDFGTVRLSPPCRVSGEVLDPGGQPAVGVNVVRAGQSAISGLKGRFTISCSAEETEPETVTASRGNLRATTTSDRPFVTLRLKPGPVLNGAVLDSMGHGLSTTVQCTSSEGERLTPTNSDGRFQIHLPPGTGSCTAPRRALRHMPVFCQARPPN